MDLWDDDNCWMASRKDKKAIMAHFRGDAGGPLDAGLCATSKWKNREREPVFFHQRPREFVQELVKGYFIKSIIDFSPHSGPWAMAALAQRLTYTG